jgi:hypothetical protein
MTVTPAHGGQDQVAGSEPAVRLGLLRMFLQNQTLTLVSNLVVAPIFGAAI